MKTFDKLEKAKTQLVLHHHFFATVLMSMPLEPVEDLNPPTAATDGKKIYYHPGFFEKLSVEEIMFVLAHEVMHIALGHPWRKEGREHTRWNRAADYAENQILVDAGFVPPKIGILLDRAYQDMHAEKIYRLLPEGEGEGRGDFTDDCRDAEGDESERAQSEARAHTIITQAAKAAQMAGQLPGNLKKLLDEVLAPKINWREELRRFMTAVLKSDQSWARGQRRFLAQGMYLPSLHSEGMGEIVVGIDTSGSVWENVPEFLAEVSAIAAECKPEKVHVIYCDTQVNAHDEYEAGQEIEPKQIGGGGTDLRKVFDYVQAKSIQPQVMVFCTDLETPFPDTPEYPVIWAANTKHEPPFGDVVRL